jgi:hypothetical protein
VRSRGRGSNWSNYWCRSYNWCWCNDWSSDWGWCNHWCRCYNRLNHWSCNRRSYWFYGCGGRSSSASSGSNNGQDGANLSGLIFLNQNLLDNTGDRRRNLGVNLVG